MIVAVRTRLMEWPPDSGVIRIRMGSYWVEYTGTSPTQAELDEFLNPDLSALFGERDGLRQNAQAAVNAIDQYLAVADMGTANQIQQRDHEQFKRLNQIVKRLIRRLVQID